MLGCCPLQIFLSRYLFSKNMSFRNTSGISNSMDPDNAQHLSLNVASAVDKVYQRNIWSPSYTVTILAMIHRNSSRVEPDGKIWMRWYRKKKVKHQYGVSRCSYGVRTIHLWIHYDSWWQRYDSPRWSYECSRCLHDPIRFRYDSGR